MRLTTLLSALVLAASSSVLASAATAQTDPSGFQATPVETIPEAFNRAFSEESGGYYENRSSVRQAAFIIGPGVPGRAGFLDLEIERDAERISNLYSDVLEQQISSDPIIRTPDLPNPFESTLLLPGSRRFSTRLQGSDLEFEAGPLR